MASEGYTAKWTDKNTILLVTLMVEEVKKGNRRTSTFSKNAWKSIKDEFTKQLGLDYKIDQLKNKMNKLRQEYSSFKKLLSISGFGWNPVLKTATTEDASLWDVHIKDNSRWEKFRKNGLPYWEQLVEIFGDVYASGDNGVGNAKNKQIPFRGRKQITTQNVMCACSFDMKFTFVYARWEGSVNDCRVFTTALETPRLEFPHPPPGKFYVVDSGYPTRDGYLTPFKGERYHLNDYRGR